MVSCEYASVLEGVSLDRILWEGDWRRVAAAYQSVRKDWDKIIVLQQYNIDGWPVNHITDSFVKEMYRVAGKLPLFGKLSLTFDRRDGAREMALLESVPSEKPLILLATTGFSSPFAHGKDLLDLLERTFPDVRILDMDTIRAERIYDLLALFERADCLVTVDSALLHLAQATPKLPVVALIADHPSHWHGSPAYEGQRLRIRYRDFERNKDRIIQTIASCLVATPALGGRPSPA